MLHIRPVSDLRNKFPEIEKIVDSGSPVFLTKNGYGSMVVLSLEEYARLTEQGTPCESALTPQPKASTKTKLFQKTSKKEPSSPPTNPELQREEDEKQLGSHTMLDHAVLPLPLSGRGGPI